ncbi:MAG: helix-hairpin-helix domain-containing protein [Ignavibacteriaceae bacterium]
MKHAGQASGKTWGLQNDFKFSIIKPMKQFSITFIFSALVLTAASFAQTDSTYLRTEEVLEDILQEPVGEFDNSDLYEELEYLIKNPVDINNADISELQRLPGMDLASAEMIINHRKKYGYFFTDGELNMVQNLDNELIKKIFPFITVKKVEVAEDVDDKAVYPFGEFLANSGLLLRSRVSNDLQTRKGFVAGKFEGTKPKVYNRLLINYDKKYQLGFLSEKDAGEVSFDEFTTYHFAVNDIGILHKAVVMDYILEFGQGLTLWSPYGFSKGSDAIYPVKKKDRIIRPYTSATEVNFFRGAAASIKLNNFIVSGFYSNNTIDANIDSVTGEIFSSPEDGLHRTESEIRKRNSAREKMMGGRIDYISGKKFKTGLLYYQSEFSNSFHSSSVYDINGNKFYYTSAYYDLYLKNINLFGEVVYNGTSVASINSVQIAITQRFAFITSIRSYPRNFISLHGFGFGERSGATTNEFGIYIGFKWRTPIGLLNFYFDQFKFPYATYTNPLPSEGNEYLVDFLSKPLKGFSLRLRYKYENKDVTETIDNNDRLVKRLKQTIRAELIYNVSKKIRLKGRFEYNSFRISAINETEDGYLFFQDFRYSPTSNFNLYGRIMFFRTESFNSAIYQYENNLTGVLTNMAMFGEGMRWYILLRYKPFRMFTLSLKFSETYKPKAKTISSGNNEIEGNIDNRVSFQLDVNL